jgi:hypothetical protein
MRIAKIALLVPAFLLLAGCSPGGEGGGQASGEHVWKEQVGTMDKAKDAEQAMLDAAAKQAEAVQKETE